MNSYVIGMSFVVLATVLSVIGMLIVRRSVGIATLSQLHEVAGYFLSVVGTLYAVLLGLVVVNSLQHVQDLRTLIDQEASGVANIFIVSEGLPEGVKHEIRQYCLQYAENVINNEWPALERGHLDPSTFAVSASLWKEITHFNPKTATEQAIGQQLISEMCSMTQNRRIRLVSSRQGTSPILWAVLLVGGIFTVAFTYFFGINNVKAQALMTLLVALTLSLNVFLVLCFSNPFAGNLAVQPDSFKLDLLIFRNVNLRLDSFNKKSSIP